jgi:hypothetical protein
MPLTLQEWLDFNIAYLLAEVVKVPAGKDFPMTFYFVTGTSEIYLRHPTSDDRDLEIALFRGMMKAAGAVQYAIISSAWVVALRGAEVPAARALMEREGTGTKYKDRRQEVYLVVAGDKDETLQAYFDVRRDYKGKIRELIRRNTGPLFSEGRLIDLLISREGKH